MIAITVEEEDAIEKFKDYKAPASTTADEVKGSPDPTPSTKEVSEPVSSPGPKISKADEAPQAEEDDRIFMSPLARKLAQDHNVLPKKEKKEKLLQNFKF